MDELVTMEGLPEISKNGTHKRMKKSDSAHLSEKEEEILEYIGKISEDDLTRSIKRVNIAKILKCSPALVNKLLKHLEEKGLIHYEKYGEIKLTNKGVQIANSLIRKHRLSEALFVDILGLESSEAHDFACKFEHIIDDKIADRIEEVLNNPSICPHGNPIPSKKTKKKVVRGNQLTSFSTNDVVIISQILKEDTDFLKKLAKMGIEVGTRIKVIEKSPIDGSLLLEINGRNFALGEKTATNLLAISGKDEVN